MADNINGLMNPGAPIEPVRSEAQPVTGDIASAQSVEPQSPAPVVKAAPTTTSVMPDAVTPNSVKPTLSVAPSIGSNEYADILDSQVQGQRQALKASLYVASKQDPDRQAEILRIAKATNIPAGVVERNFDQFKAQDRVAKNDYDTILQNSPKTAEWLSNPTNASVAQDDVRSLRNVEQSVQDHGIMMSAVNTIESGMAGLGSQIAKLPALGVDLYNYRDNLIARLSGRPEDEVKTPDWLRNNFASKYFDQLQADIQAREPLLGDTTEAYKNGDWKRLSMMYTAKVLQGAPQLAAMVGASALTGGLGGVVFMGATTAAGAAGEAEAQGADPAMATTNALGKGMFAAGTAHVLQASIFNRIFSEVAKEAGPQAATQVVSGVFKNIAMATGVEGANNTAMQFGNDMVDYTTGLKKTPFENAGSKAVESFVIGGMTGGFLAAPGAYGVAHAQAMLNRRAEMNRDFLTNLKDQIDQTKLNARAPEQSLNHTAQTLSDTPVENLLVNPEAVDTYFQSKKLDPVSEMQKAGMLKEYTEAKESGRDMQVPTAEFAHKLDQEHVKGLGDDIKFSPDALSVNEAKDLKDKTADALSAVADEIKGDSQDQSYQDQADQVGEGIAAQLVQSGVYNKQVAEKNAYLQARRYQTRGEILGESPLDLYNRDNLSIVRADGRIVPTDRAYNQDQNMSPEAAPARELLATIDTPEKAAALKGENRQKYLDALTQVYGDRETRLKRLIEQNADLKEYNQVFDKEESLNTNPGHGAAVDNILKPGTLFRSESLPIDSVQRQAGSKLEKYNEPLHLETADDERYAAEYAKLPQETYKSITVQPDRDGKYNLESGRHRTRAAFLRGDKAVRADVLHRAADAAFDPRFADSRNILNQSNDRPFQTTVPMPAEVNVVKVDTSDLSPSEVRKQASADFKGQTFTNEHTGWAVEIPRKGLNKASQTLESLPNRLAFLNLDRLIESAIYARSEENRKGTGNGVDVLYAPMSDGAKDYLVKITLRDAEGKKFYDKFAIENESTARSTLERSNAPGIDEEQSSKSTPSNLEPSEGLRPSASIEAKQSIDQFLNDVNLAQRNDPLFQNGDENSPRAQIEFHQSGVTIRLGKDSNLSSFAHEGGHLWLKQMGDDFAKVSAIPEADRSAKQIAFLKDAESTLKWLKVDSFESIERDHHEQFARGTEQWLREGRAPSARLRQVFSDFARWLTALYKHASDLQVELSPEIRDVFSRLVASQDAIDQAQRELNVKPLFNDPKAVGMSDQKAYEYMNATAWARQAAEDQINKKLMAVLKREQSKRYEAQEEIVRTEVEKQVNEQPDQVALSVLQKGLLPDGSALPEGVEAIKLSKNAIIEQFGKDALDRLPKPYVFAKEGGIDPRGAAQMFGFNSASDLLDALANAEKKDALVDRLTDEKMKAEHGDLLTDGSMPTEALKAVHNEKRSQLLKLELEHLATNDLGTFKEVIKRVSRRVPDLNQVREQAKATIGNKLVRDTRPELFERAEAKASKEAVEHMLKGDLDAAFQAKQKELLAHELFRAASDAKEQTDKTVDYMQKFKKASKLEQLGRTDYLDQINAIRNRFDFSNVSLKKLDSLTEFAREKEMKGDSAGENVFIPDILKDDLKRTNFKNLTNDELQGVRDTVKQLEHMAIQADKILSHDERVRKAEAKAELIGALKANLIKGKPRPFTDAGMTIKDRATRTLQQADASFLKMEQLVKFFDGGDINGPWHRFLFDGASEAQNAERDYSAKITAKLVRDVMNIPPEIHKRLAIEVKVPGIERTMTRKDLLGVALNVGNEGNYNKLRDGHGWSDDQIKYMTDQLTEGEIKFVNGVHETLASMWPDIAKLQKKLTGLEPEKVALRKFTAKNGAIEGYYPLMYDSIGTVQGEMQLATTAGKLVEDGYTRATTPKGHTKARTGFVAPIDLDIGRLPNHISGVIKDLTHRKWLIDANYLVNDRQVREAVADHFGEPYQRMMSDWVKQVVNSRNAPSNQAAGLTDRALNFFRQNAMIAAMGFSVKSILSHYGHLGVAADSVGEGNGFNGTKWLCVGFSKFLRNPKEAYRFAAETSGEMRHFIDSIDRDFSDKLHTLRDRSDIRATMQKTALQGIHWAVQSVAIPTWHAAYERGLALGHDEATAIKQADLAVRSSLGASGPKDKAAFYASNNSLLKMMSMFGTPISAFYNKQRDYVHDVSTVLQTLKGQSWDQMPATLKNDLPRLITRPLFIYMVTSTLSEMWASDKPGSDAPLSEWAKWWGENQALFPFMSVPGVREIVSAAKSGRGYQISPLEDAGRSTVEAVQAGRDYLKGDAEFSKFAEKSFKASGYYIGVPTNQMSITGQYLAEVARGDEHPQSISEFAKRLLLRKPKNE